MNLLGNSEQCLVSISDIDDSSMNDVSDGTFCITTHVAPDVVALPQVDGEAAIVAAGLAVGTVTSGYSDTVPEGSIVSQQPAAGAPICLGGAVDIVVSIGSKPIPAWTKPAAETKPATDIGSDTLRLQGIITDDGEGSCEYRFVYWKSGDGWFSYTPWAGYVRQGETFSHVLTGLATDTTYYYWAEARNSEGRSKGWDSGIEIATTSP
jgi:hypothetical protein